MIQSGGRGLIAEHQATMPCQAAAGENNLGIFDYFCSGPRGLVNPINAG